MNILESMGLPSLNSYSLRQFLSDLVLRKKLITAIIESLTVPDEWRCEGVFSDEGDEKTAILCRFMPSHNKFHIMLCCPYGNDETWLLVYLSKDDDDVLLLRKSEAFDPELLSHSLELTAFLDSKDLLVSEIKKTLSFEVMY
ncbi:conjugation system SOS inhibitor PsiB family protein [Enterobacter sp. ECC-175]|uniref:conjugation system SOS inhibitor PsiB family protein n=1 Tax=unclassified Enterobacter TaxID=2608935 RepID=UPI000D496BAF|nr:conjugation system SOS inhibitor PsiB family protein [Enterobacter sp. RIT 418]RAU29872.1 hypothetical protein DBY73_021500 [Enterobacter sp. RIT 418]